MGAQVLEITGYVPAFLSLYMTGKNVDGARLEDVLSTVEKATNRWGFLNEDAPEEIKQKFMRYMDLLIKYGIKKEHETLLDYIKIVVFMQDLHRGAQDDYDAHAKRMTIIRSSTRANKKSSDKPSISEWYKGRILPFFEVNGLPDKITKDGVDYVRSSWGYVREDLINDPDVLRGNVALSVACDNVSEMSYRNWRHVYHLRRRGNGAAPELSNFVEEVRSDLTAKMPPLGDLLGKVFARSISTGEEKFVEKTQTFIACE